MNIIINAFDCLLTGHIINLGETSPVIEIKDCPEIPSPSWNIKVVRLIIIENLHKSSVIGEVRAGGAGHVVKIVNVKTIAAATSYLRNCYCFRTTLIIISSACASRDNTF